jgi:hypothetical protein
MQRKRGSEASSQRVLQDEKAKKSFARGLRDLVTTNRRRLAQKRQKTASGDPGAEAHNRGGSGGMGGHAACAGPAVTAAASMAPRASAAPREQSPSAMHGFSGGTGTAGEAMDVDLESLPPQLTLQLFPVDEPTLAAVAAAGWNPHLELTFRCVLPRGLRF